MEEEERLRNVESAAGLIDRSDRHRVEACGPDRVKFLHNLTTNDVKGLVPGRGHEAFVTGPQGKTLGYVVVLAAEDRLLVRSDPGGMRLALPHLRKYGAFDEMTLEDRTDETFELHLAGGKASEVVRRAFGDVPEECDYAHGVRTAAKTGARARLVRESPTLLPGWTLIGERGDRGAVVEALREAAEEFGGLVDLSPALFEALRIEAGTPVFGVDVTERNLPQEIGRDERAISFKKGCYLGQETVARIDALGHVNQMLKGLVFEPGAACPAGGSALEADGRRVGTITSATGSPAPGRPLALALVRSSHARAGTVLSVIGPDETKIAATVSDLPLPRTKELSPA